jgi:hypothetical protein
MPDTTISADIEIAAAPERVWAVLTDLDGYRAWNPVWREASGQLTPGSKVTITSARPTSDKILTVKVKVVTDDPPTVLRWRSNMLLGLSGSTHSFVLTPEAGGTLLVQSQAYRGMFTRFPYQTIRRIQSSFEAINQAIKEQAEGRFS